MSIHKFPAGAPSKFKQGDVVSLNSGGLFMTVRGVSKTPGGWFDCVWLTEHGEDKLCEFHADELISLEDVELQRKEP
jgi:uncharacterized protein YodC (DUF2158 family)